MENTGQKVEIWTNEWEKLSPESEIRMWDYFGLRQWILKYTPRHGKVLEAGCGLGRNNFYLSKLGIETIGLDFSEQTIDFLKDWQRKYNFNIPFITGDIKNLHFGNSSLSAYLSFGVVEHFIEGPQTPLLEAYRVLRPGGIAIISTPAPSWSKLYFKTLGKLKLILKKVLGRTLLPRPFFQYEYSSRKLKEHVSNAGFYITRFSGADWLYTFTEFGNNTDRYITQNSFGYKISHLLETSVFANLGAQSIVIAIKTEKLMHCFFCNEITATLDSLIKYDVPVCFDCQSDSNVHFYEKNRKIKFHTNYSISPSFDRTEYLYCEFCKQEYQLDYLFEHFGFNRNVCPNCLQDQRINIYLSNTSIKPVWRKRSQS